LDAKSKDLTKAAFCGIIQVEGKDMGVNGIDWTVKQCLQETKTTTANNLKNLFAKAKSAVGSFVTALLPGDRQGYTSSLVFAAA